MIKKISRKRFLSQYPDFPVANYHREKYNYPETYRRYILYVDAKSTKGMAKNVSIELRKLILALNSNNIFCMGDANISWLYRDHDFKPVKEGLSYLVENNISKSFSGALNIGIDDIVTFLIHLFWLVRCNGVVFIPHFCDLNFNVIVSICQYGNIHLSTLSEIADVDFHIALQKTKIHISEDNKCAAFKIAGRKALL